MSQTPSNLNLLIKVSVANKKVIMKQIIIQNSLKKEIALLQYKLIKYC